MWNLIDDMLYASGIKYAEGWLIEMYIRIADSYGLSAVCEVMYGDDYTYIYW